MQNTVAAPEFEDFGSHQRMWDGFTHLMVRSLIAIIVLILFLGFVTGVL